MVSNRAERHRRDRPTPAIPVVVDELDTFDEDELWYMLVDYHCSPLGAWTATVAPDGLGPVKLQAMSGSGVLVRCSRVLARSTRCRRTNSCGVVPVDCRKRRAKW